MWCGDFSSNISFQTNRFTVAIILSQHHQSEHIPSIFSTKPRHQSGAMSGFGGGGGGFGFGSGQPGGFGTPGGNTTGGFGSSANEGSGFGSTQGTGGFGGPAPSSFGQQGQGGSTMFGSSPNFVANTPTGGGFGGGFGSSSSNNTSTNNTGFGGGNTSTNNTGFGGGNTSANNTGFGGGNTSNPQSTHFGSNNQGFSAAPSAPAASSNPFGGASSSGGNRLTFGTSSNVVMDNNNNDNNNNKGSSFHSPPPTSTGGWSNPAAAGGTETGSNDAFGTTSSNATSSNFPGIQQQQQQSQTGGAASNPFGGSPSNATSNAFPRMQQQQQGATPFGGSTSNAGSNTYSSTQPKSQNKEWRKSTAPQSASSFQPSTRNDLASGPTTGARESTEYSTADQEKRLKAKMDERKRLQIQIEEKKRKLMERTQKKQQQLRDSSALSARAPPFVPKPVVPTDAVAEGSSIQPGKSFREYQPEAGNSKTRALMPQGIKATGVDHNKESGRDGREDLDTAKSLVGTCQYMCPDDELLRREGENDIQVLEIPQPGTLHPPNWTLRDTVVKRFRRSAADYKVREPKSGKICLLHIFHLTLTSTLQLDVPEWVRPPDVLETVCAYLEEWVMVSIVLVAWIDMSQLWVDLTQLILSNNSRIAIDKDQIPAFLKIKHRNLWMYISLYGIEHGWSERILRYKTMLGQVEIVMHVLYVAMNE
jgi:hypothetical protein